LDPSAVEVTSDSKSVKWNLKEVLSGIDDAGSAGTAWAARGSPSIPATARPVKDAKNLCFVMITSIGPVFCLIRCILYASLETA
jgi:hypothetical protein